MHILYVIDQDIHSGKTSGIIHKIQGKIRLWEEKGFKVSILSLYSFRMYSTNLDLIDDSNSFTIKKHSKIMTLFRLVYSSYLLKKHLKNYSFDLIYMRTRLFTPFISKALAPFKVIFELNSDDVEEWKCNNKLIWKYNNITRAFFYNLACSFVSVSYELTERYKEFNKPTITIGNGVLVSNYPFNVKINNLKPQICFVGSPGFKWHGIDKILDFAAIYKEYDFHIIGEEGDSRSNVSFYGYLGETEVNNILLRSDVAISTLSLHEKNMDEASPLKSRQYLAMGVPLIYAYKDTDLTGEEEFALRIPNNKDNVKNNGKLMKDFIDKCFRNDELRVKAREFALNTLDVNNKENARLEFFEKILNEDKILK